MKLIRPLLDLLFPPRCPFCRRILPEDTKGLCSSCTEQLPTAQAPSHMIPGIDQWSAVWYYEGSIRASLLRFKFRGARRYAKVYAPYLADKIRSEFSGQFDVLTYVPVSGLRRFRRGYDQSGLLAKETGKLLGITAQRTLRKVRHTRPQSSLKGIEDRRTNVLRAYRPVHSENYSGKRILLLDDIITTGATSAECAKTLLQAGAAKVLCVAAATRRDKK